MITKGLLTYEVEGNEGGPYHSRVFHVPSDSSGLTIGRGYDMRDKTFEGIAKDLISCGVDEDLARTIAKSSGLKGQGAKTFMSSLLLDPRFKDFEISMETQEALFVLIYDRLEADVIRICNKQDCVDAYGAVDWPNLHPKIKEILVDLRYRGDYHSRSRRQIQSLVAENDFEGFYLAMKTKPLWTNIPAGRFDARVKYLEGSL